MSVVAAAVVGSAVVGAYASNKASKAQAKSTQQASDTQLQAQRETNEMQWDMYEQNRKDQEPWRKAGETALGQLSTGLKAGGEFNRNFQVSDFQKTRAMPFASLRA